MQMKKYLPVFFVLISVTAWSQPDAAAPKPQRVNETYRRHTTIATLSMGFIDPNRQNFSVPAGFQKGASSGYSQIYGQLEYALSNSLGIAAAFGYDAFQNNYSKLYKGYNGAIQRYQTDHTRIASWGINVCYHLGKVIQVKNLDPFIGAGISLDNIRHSAAPRGDSIQVTMEHKVSPYLKAGVRYYLNKRFSLYGDVGYAHQSMIDAGVSFRFFPGKSAK
jgi:hypothetical protein